VEVGDAGAAGEHAKNGSIEAAQALSVQGVVLGAFVVAAPPVSARTQLGVFDGVPNVTSAVWSA
jgi:hypothetical protein